MSDHREKPIERKFEDALNLASSTAPIFTHNAKQQMGKMVDTILRSNNHIQTRLATNQSPQIKGGFIAEEFHAETFNLDAILKDKDVRAITDQYKPEWGNFNRAGNDNSLDVIVHDKGNIVKTAQSKYGQNAETTAGKGSVGFSQVKDGQVKYTEADTYLGPSDQINPKDGSVSVKEHAEAAAWGNEKRGGDPKQTEAYKQTAKKVRSKIEHDGVASKNLTKSEADTLGSGDTKKFKDIESNFQTRSTFKQMGNAAVGAAALSAVISGTVNIIQYCQLARDGKISSEEAVQCIIVETATSAADSALKASAVVGVQSLLVRYGEKVVIETFAKQSLKALMRGNAVTTGVVCAIDAAKDLVALSVGKISKEEFFERQGKGMLNTSAGVIGGTLGAVSAASFVTSMGFSFPIAAPLLGGLAGGLIAGMAMNFAIENHIEKPYRQLVENTTHLADAARELQKVSSTVFASQVLFAKALEEEAYLDKLFAVQLHELDKAGERAALAISKI